MKTPNIIYHRIEPPPETFLRIFDLYIDLNPDAIVLGTEDYCKFDDSTLKRLSRANEMGIPVFGIRRTLLRSNKHTFYLNQGSDAFVDEYVIDSGALKTGFIPLLAVPHGITQMADDVKKAIDNYPQTPTEQIEVVLNIEQIFDFIIGGIGQVCSEFDDYDRRVLEARKRFSDSRFNDKIDKMLGKI
jgi:hypothetical protein